MTNFNLREQGGRVRAAARGLAQASDEQRRLVLSKVANALESKSDALLGVNESELSRFEGEGAARDRLQLSASRVKSMAEALREIASLPDPLYEESEKQVRSNGLRVKKIRVPLGVIGVVYENRPNVTSDVAGLCVRSGNAAFLRGSSSALETNKFIVGLWQTALVEAGLSKDTVSLVEDTSHETAVSFMQLTDVLDCLIPRGGPSLIAAMREHARVPYVLDGDGNCHVYVDADADLAMAAQIIRNAKVSRPGVCNAAETLLVHEDVAAVFLPQLDELLPEVELRADERARKFLPNALLATDKDFSSEFLDLILAVGVVSSFDDAVVHVATNGTGHSEAIVTQNPVTAQRWIREVDAAAVLVNASTRFIDGGELGLGGEVGISTQKLHARGPMGLRELTCLKWVVEGEGQIR
jgi:glutamate-5-semialdehyde dehydrogenase